MTSSATSRRWAAGLPKGEMRLLELRIGDARDALDRFEAAWNRRLEGRRMATLHVLSMGDLPLLLRTLKLMRAPAKVAGLQDLQDFLERGFESFREMDGAAEFLALVRERETAILNRLFSGAPDPFST